MLVGDMAKRWTKAMRRKAAEDGRRGGALGDRAGKRRGGLVAWHTKTPDEQATVKARLRACGGRQRNTSAKARAAQRARGKAGVLRPSLKKALFLADLGMMGRMPAAAPVALPAAPQAAGRPRPEDYADASAWLRAVDAWDAAAARAESAGGEAE